MKLRLLDLFAGAGGCTKGYQRAGFHVTGVDLVASPNYCGDEFEQADVMDVLRDWDLLAEEFDVIHASPPCQHYANVTRWRGDQDDHPDLIEPVRRVLRRIKERQGRRGAYVIENVRTPELRANLMLCGSQFDLPIRRHRYFDCSFFVPPLLPPCQHRSTDYSFDHGGKQPDGGRSVTRGEVGALDERPALEPGAYYGADTSADGYYLTLLVATRKGKTMSGSDLITAERQRQIVAEGWTPEHDAEHVEGEMARAAKCYLAAVTDGYTSMPAQWPWHYSWWKPSDDPIRNLVKAGALIAAEIDRLSRRQ